MKKIYLVATSFFFVVFGFSQSRYTVVQFNKKDVPGVILKLLHYKHKNYLLPYELCSLAFQNFYQ